VLLQCVGVKYISSFHHISTWLRCYYQFRRYVLWKIKKYQSYSFLLLPFYFYLFSKQELPTIRWSSVSRGGRQHGRSQVDSWRILSFYQPVHKTRPYQRLLFQFRGRRYQIHQTGQAKIRIVSFATYTINNEYLAGSKILLQTLPLPEGKPVETYTIVGIGSPRQVTTAYHYIRSSR